ncbi:MAG: aspartate-semialdehyde dehydrogenase, partial [Armatimonadota bacterium]
MNQGLSVAIVGATGAVGAEFIRLFEERNVPINRIKFLASKRSVGKTVTFKGTDYSVEEALPTAFE